MDYLVNIGKQKQEVEFGGNVYISMSPAIYQELLAYVDHYSTEVSGCGMIEIVQHKDAIEYAIKEVMLPREQKNSASYTEAGEPIMHTMLYEMAKEGVDTSKMRLHWHSHNDMGVFHSGTDEDNYATLLKQDYFVSLVINKKREVLGRIDLAIPFTVSVSGVAVYIRVPLPESNATIQGRIDSNIKALDTYIAKTDKDEEGGWRGNWNRWKRDNDTVTTKHSKKNKHKEDYEADMWERYSQLYDQMHMYSPSEQDEFEACTGFYDEKHTCSNALECSAYNALYEELATLEAELGIEQEEQYVN